MNAQSEESYKAPGEGRNPDRTYTTPAIAVEWESRYCIHAAQCIMSQPEVFDPRRRPWVRLDAADAGAIAEAVMRCPTGALHYRRLDGGAEEPVPTETEIMALANGPLLVRGDSVVETLGGTVLRHDTRMALCRCGASHRRSGFRAP